LSSAPAAGLRSLRSGDGSHHRPWRGRPDGGAGACPHRPCGQRRTAPRATRPEDVRAYALNAGSLALLERLGVLARLPADATTGVHDMRVQGDGAGAGIAFSAWEQNADRLAAIVDAAALDQALEAAVAEEPRVSMEPVAGTDAELHVHAEGRDAVSRDALGGRFVRHDYGQRAIAARLVGTRPHAHTARQWFRGADVLALLPFDRPMAGRSHALVWSLPDARAAELLEADPAAFERALQEALGDDAASIGMLSLASPRAAWPLASGRAERWCGPGWVLAGDAAHVVHPLAGQGLNLGLGDVATLVDVLAAREPWRAIGDERLLRRYVRQRAAHTAAMMSTIDGLQQLFSAPGAVAAALRNNGLALVDRSGPLKRWLAGRALGA
jgi:2-polyprenyl-6-methoxyphenol hydroxylase-like FAD-dependent oxidoreductase